MARDRAAATCTCEPAAVLSGELFPVQGVAGFTVMPVVFAFEIVRLRTIRLGRFRTARRSCVPSLATYEKSRERRCDEQGFHYAPSYSEGTALHVFCLACQRKRLLNELAHLTVAG
jgi:hypothetical protein